MQWLLHICILVMLFVLRCSIFTWKTILVESSETGCAHKNNSTKECVNRNGNSKVTQWSEVGLMLFKVLIIWTLLQWHLPKKQTHVHKGIRKNKKDNPKKHLLLLTSFQTLTAFSSCSSASLTSLLHFVIWKTMMSLGALTARVTVLYFMQAVMLFVQVEVSNGNFHKHLFYFLFFPFSIAWRDGS